MSPWDRHAAYRERLARRLDAELSAADMADLDAHLAACPACRAVAAEYTEQHQLFRSLAADEPPRDLWARTMTALDHEVAHGVRRPSRLAFGVLASLGALLALVSTQSGLLPGLGQPRTAGATPFAVTPQPVAYITRQGDELTIYQTQVSELCPAPAYDCTNGAADTTPLLRVDTNMDPSDLALGTGGSLVITGRDREGHAIYSVLELPDASSSAAASGDVTTATRSPSLATTPRATPSTPPRTASPRPTPSSGATASADASPAATTDITPPPSPSEAPTPVPGHTRAILSNVIAAGAPAAWSPEGNVLAFSAMPADGSHGPDIYTWRPGEPAARPLTNDHRSWFASWVGARILASHAARAVGKAGTPLPALETILIDPATHETRTVDLSGAWLPSVDPSGRYVIYFKGTLERAGAGLRAVDGKLILAPWRALDPYAEAPAASDEASPNASAPARATAPGSSARPAPAASATPASAGWAPAASSRATASARASGAAPDTAVPTPSVAPTAPAFSPFTLATPGDRIADWLVRWTSDGSAYGLWVARTADSDAGVLLVAPTAADGRVQPDLLPPTPALRAFSIGLGHAAWVAPMGDQDEELRVITWGPGGSGGVRLQRVGSGTLAF